MTSTRHGAPRWWEHHWWVVGLVALAVLVAVELVASLQMNGVFAGAAIVTGIAAGPRPTAAVAALAVVAAAGSGVWNDNLGEREWASRFVVCCLLAWLAVVTAGINQRRRAAVARNTELAQGVLAALAVELTGARTVGEVAEGFAVHATATLGAASAMVLSLDADDVLRAVAWHGRGGAAADHYREISLHSDVPGAVAVRDRVDLHYRSVREIEAAFPDLAGYYPSERSLHALPLHRGGETYGALALTFAPDRFGRVEDSLLRAVADALTSAVIRVQELQAADAAAQRVALLAEASLTLSRSLDLEETVAETGRLLVPRFADWCAVQLVRDGVLETVGVRHHDEETSRWANGLRDAFPTRMDRTTGAPQVVRTGRSELYPYIPDHLLEASAVNAEHLQILRRLGFTSAIVAPLRGRDGVIGAVTLIHSGSGRRYVEADVGFLEAVAAQVAVAIERAASFEEQSARLAGVTLVADAAQRAILTPPPERLGPLRLSARYHSAAAEAQVGGDLYEVVARGTTTRLLVGDVRGKGLAAVRTATVVLGQFRAAAVGDGDAADLACGIDRDIRPYLVDAEDFVTAVLVDLELDGRFTVVCCGHPSPMVLHAGGEVEVLQLSHALPLGLGARPQVTHGHLGPGDRLLLYTDGLIEARGDDRTFIDPLPYVERAAVEALPQALDSLLAGLTRAAGHELDDDLALLLVCFDPALSPAG